MFHNDEHRVFFTSDNHFYHKNIKKFRPNTRQGETVAEMNELMIEKWNSQVRPHDMVFALGDFSFGTADQTFNIIAQLHGQIHLIYGNHDKVIRSNSEVRGLFASTAEYREITVNEKHVVMLHYPMREWNRMHRGSYHLFGHVHGGLPEAWGRSMDVGIDTRPNGDMSLWAWDEVDALLSQRPILEH